MTSADHGGQAGDDRGLLTPGHVGTAAETATGDAAFLQAMLDAESALARARATVGLAPARAATAITAAARAALFDARELALRARQGGNPVIPLVAELTTAVAHRDAKAAGHVHQGATSQDILDTATMLVARRSREAILADLAAAATTLATLTTAHRDTPMPGRTLTQHAVPTTFGLKAAGWHSLVRDAHDRLAAVRLPAQLGGAAGTLAAFTAEAEARATAAVPASDEDVGLRLLATYSREVGLAEPLLPWHALRTPVADLGCALAFVTCALGKVAADVLVLSRTEVGEVAEGAGGGSSAMPHKATPSRPRSSPRRRGRHPRSPPSCSARSAPRTNGPPGPGTPSGSPCGISSASRAAPHGTEPISSHGCASSPPACTTTSPSPAAC